MAAPHAGAEMAAPRQCAQLRDPETGLAVLSSADISDSKLAADVPHELRMLFSRSVPVLHFMSSVDKISRWGRRQPRVLFVGNRAVYLTDVQGVVTRCIQMAELRGIVVVESAAEQQTTIGLRTDPQTQYDLLFRLSHPPGWVGADGARRPADCLVNILTVLAKASCGGEHRPPPACTGWWTLRRLWSG
eukprot:TRINITY_DN1480_c0_g1_i3.p1 TRINITY_DN1480_c0_g1~~TRINITY_DN1480_c0_g1_i3.p1  ORF type:complete len:206 (+),score=47.16 TRINITY_DN1480_c0_g1_i3:54-620(+)